MFPPAYRQAENWFLRLEERAQRRSEDARHVRQRRCSAARPIHRRKITICE